MKEVAV